MLRDDYKPPKGFKLIKQGGYPGIRKETRVSKKWRAYRKNN